MSAWEYNFDGLVGPTHNYAGLATGNTASIKNRHTVSNPRRAALEGLEKMKFLMDRGFKQGILPPQSRPDLDFLRELGLTGRAEKLLKSAYNLSPPLLSACYSASSMWTANCALVSPGADTKDGKVHFTPANLHFHLHRSLESQHTARILKKIFTDPRHFTHHRPLPSRPAFADEGSANHNRLCADYGSPGVEIFVYGKSGFSSVRNTKIFAPRQTREAGEVIALRHQLNPAKTIFLPQNPKAVDAGVFHNDVICVADQNLIFYHEEAFVQTEKALREMERQLSPVPLIKIPVQTKDISLTEAVSSYLFNSQLLPNGKGKWILLAPSECSDLLSVKSYLQSLTQNSAIEKVHFFSLRQSMKNGGGPACLRLRVVLTKEESEALPPAICLNQKLYKKLKKWIETHYRDRLRPKDLLDPLLIRESQTALDELSQILQLKNIYPFQG